MSVILISHDLLSIAEVILDNMVPCLVLSDDISSSRGGGLGDSATEQGGGYVWVDSVQDCEWTQSGGAGGSPVVGELSFNQMEVPIVLVGGRVDPQILFQSAVRTFCLTIGLLVVRRGQIERRLEEPEERRPEHAGESRIAVGHNGAGYTVVSVDVFEEQCCEIRCGGFSERFDEHSLLAKPIDKDNDGVVTVLGAWKLRDQVHGDRVPRAIGDRKWLQKTVLSNSAGLVQVALMAGPDVVLDRSEHSGPIECLAEELVSPINSLMTCRWFVMVTLE